MTSTVSESFPLDRRGHVYYLLLAGMYFGLHSVSLSAISVAGLRSERGTLIASIAISLYSGLGLICDLAVGVATIRFGAPAIIRSGVALGTVGAVGLFTFSGAAGALVGASALGLGTSFLIVPILGGVANTAPVTKQVASQAINATIQRVGALCATTFLVGLTVGSDTKLLALGMASLLGAILIGSFFIGTVSPPDDFTIGSLGEGFRALGLMIRQSLGYQIAVIINLVTVMLIIYGNSYLISALRLGDRVSLFAPGLALREIAAVLVAVMIFWRPSLAFVRSVWMVSSIVGTAGLAGLTLFDKSSAVDTVLISLHGAAISSGIILSNSMIYFHARREQRFIGFAGASVVARLFGFMFPLAMAGLGDSGPTLGGLLVFALGVLIVSFVGVVVSQPRCK